MLAVTKLAGSKQLSPWVIFCAVACIGVGIGAGTDLGTDAAAEVSSLVIRPHSVLVFGLRFGRQEEESKREVEAPTRIDTQELGLDVAVVVVTHALILNMYGLHNNCFGPEKHKKKGAVYERGTGVLLRLAKSIHFH